MQRAFALTTGSRDAALLVTLPPGEYTAQVSGSDDGTGVALVEVYEVNNLLFAPLDSTGLPPPPDVRGRTLTAPRPLFQELCR